MSGLGNLPGAVYDALALPVANRRQLTEYESSGWSGLDVLYVPSADGTGGLDCYPWIGDSLHGRSVNALNRGALDGVCNLLRGNFGAGSKLRMLRFQTGQFVESGRGPKPLKREYDDIRSLVEKVNQQPTPSSDAYPPLDRPTESWRLDEFAALYEDVRRQEARQLRAEVAQLASEIVTANQVTQLFVQEEFGSGRGVGMLGPLVGLAINGTFNPYSEQIHTVLPVVKQDDESLAVLQRAAGGLYAKRAEH